MQQWYVCQKCQQYVKYGEPVCPRCGGTFYWPTLPAQQDTGAFSKHWWINSPIPKLVILFAILAGVFIWVSNSLAYTSSKTAKSSAYQEYAYASEISANTRTIGAALADITDILEKLDTGWQDRLIVKLNTLRAGIREARAISAPASMQQIHSTYLTGLDHYYKAADLFEKGVTDMDSAAIHSAVQEISAGIAYIDQTTQLIKEYTASK